MSRKGDQSPRHLAEWTPHGPWGGGRWTVCLPPLGSTQALCSRGTSMAAPLAEMLSALLLSCTGPWFSSEHLRASFFPRTPAVPPQGAAVVVQSLSRVQVFTTPFTAARQASLPITSSGSFLKLTFVVSVMPSNHLILCPLLLLPSIFPSIRVFSNESALRIRWPNDWSLSFSISPPNEHPGLISFRMDWLNLLTVQGTLKSLLQHHNSEASIPRCSAFFMVRLSQPHMTGKTIALTICTFVGRGLSLFSSTLPRFVAASHGPEHRPNPSYASETHSAAAALSTMCLMMPTAAWPMCARLSETSVHLGVPSAKICFTHQLTFQFRFKW